MEAGRFNWRVRSADAHVSHRGCNLQPRRARFIDRLLHKDDGEMLRQTAMWLLRALPDKVPAKMAKYDDRLHSLILARGAMSGKQRLKTVELSLRPQ